MSITLWSRFSDLARCCWRAHTPATQRQSTTPTDCWRTSGGRCAPIPTPWPNTPTIPVSELDLHARHRWLVAQRADVERLLAEPDWYDAKAAGWWVVGISQWIGEWVVSPARVANGDLPVQLPTSATRAWAFIVRRTPMRARATGSCPT